MTSLFTARRRAEEFAAAVEGDPARRRDHHAGSADLLDLVEALRAQPEVAPRADFSRELRARLMAQAATVLTPENASLHLPARPRGTRERRLVAAATAAVLLGGTATMATAAQSALPGEVLYPVKRGLERVDAGLSASPSGRGKDLLDQANARLTEVERLLSSDAAQSAPRVPETLESFTLQATEGADLMFESYQESRDPRTIEAVRVFAADAIASLEEMAGSVPDDAQDELADAAVALRDIDDQATALCGTCASDLPPLDVPGILLVRAEVDSALQRIGLLSLNNDHPVVVPRGVLDGLADLAVPTDPDALDPDAATNGTPAPTTEPNPLPSPESWAPEDLVKPLLPGADEDAPGSTTGGDGAQQDLTDGLGGVETVLPDAETLP